MATFKVNWRLEGFRDRVHNIGERIEAEFKEVEHLLADSPSVLTLLGDDADAEVVPVDLSALSNDDLVTYAKEKFNFDLDPSLEREALIAEIAALVASTPDTDGAGSETNLAEMTKAQLIAYAKDKHDVVLAPALNKAALIAEITALEAKV
jgi:hypothetical protein